jgi:hypothetical protein
VRLKQQTEGPPAGGPSHLAPVRHALRPSFPDARIDIGQGQRELHGGDANNRLGASKDFRPRCELSACSRPNPSFRLLLREDDIGEKAWNPQILGGFVAEIDFRGRRRQHFGQEHWCGRRVSLVGAVRVVDHDVGITQSFRSGVQSEFRDDVPSLPIEPVPQCGNEVCDDPPMKTRGPRHHHNTTPRKLIPSLVRLHPGDEGSLVHAQVRLDVHGRLVANAFRKSGIRAADRCPLSLKAR